MGLIKFVLNLPWTVVGFLGSILSIPTAMSVSRKPFALVINVKSFWWYSWLPGMNGIRGMANGNVVQLGPTADKADLAHELIHVEQYSREPFVHPFLYAVQSSMFGYKNNKYEREAYSRSGNRYVQ